MSRRPTGNAVPGKLRMRQWRARQYAKGLRPEVTWIPRRRSLAAQPPPLAQRVFEARTLALWTITAAKIEREPEFLDLVYRNFERWEDRERITPGASIRLWRNTLRLPWPQIAARLTEQSPQGLRLRATTPLFGILSGLERRRLFEAFQVPPRLTP
jgi:hypothetical protein